MIEDFKSAASVSLIYYIVSYVILLFVLRKLPNKMNRDKQNIFLTSVIFPNVGNMGYPVIASLLGDQAMIIAVICNLIWQLVFFTIGISILKDEKSINLIDVIKNPLTLSAVLALILYFSPFRLPEAIYLPLSDVGKIVTPISMILIGAILSDISLKSLLNDQASFVVAGLRLLVIPISVIFILKQLNISILSYQTIVILFAMPTASTVTIQATLYDKEPAFAARITSLNTALFALSFPLILYLMNL